MNRTRPTESVSKAPGMTKPATDEWKTLLQPIASLISKSEKAQQKLTPGTWQHTMLQVNLKALHIASALMNKQSREVEALTQDDLQDALRAFATMTTRSEKARAKFTPGTSPHTLQQNRLRAFRAAEASIAAALS